MVDRDCPHAKERFSSKGAAIVAQKAKAKRCRARKFPHKEKRREVAKLIVYQCHLCDGWHIGGDHRPSLPGKGKR